MKPMEGTRKLDDRALVDHLREQVRFIEASGRSFDSGFEGEAKRLATAIRVLVHDTPNSQSVLQQLGVKNRLAYADTAETINPRNLLPTAGLVMGRVESGVGGAYVAPLDNLSPPRIHPPAPFRAWWEAPVTKMRDGTRYSRRDYVLTVANKEGGAHVDPSLDVSWIELTRDNALGWMYFEESVEEPFQGNLALQSVRQIAYELERTIEDQLDLAATARADLLRTDRVMLIPAGTGRNDPCPCGSGKKYKRCHGG